MHIKGTEFKKSLSTNISIVYIIDQLNTESIFPIKHLQNLKP